MDMDQFDATQLMTAMLDFHLLVYLATMDLLPVATQGNLNFDTLVYGVNVWMDGVA